jgi:hypothetical protein
VFEADGVPSTSSGQARTWSSSFLSVGSIVSLQYDLPFCGFRFTISLLGNHTKIPQERSDEGHHTEKPRNGNLWDRRILSMMLK